MARDKGIRFGRIVVNPDRLGSTLKDQRVRLGYSHRSLAEAAGVAPTTVYNLEQGSHKVQLDKFLAVLGALDLLPEHVLEIDDKPGDLPVSRLESEIRDILATCALDEALVRLGDLLGEIQD